MLTIVVYDVFFCELYTEIASKILDRAAYNF